MNKISKFAIISVFLSAQIVVFATEMPNEIDQHSHSVSQEILSSLPLTETELLTQKKTNPQLSQFNSYGDYFNDLENQVENYWHPILSKIFIDPVHNQNDLCKKDRFYRIINRYPDIRDERFEDDFKSYYDYIAAAKKICYKEAI